MIQLCSYSPSYCSWFDVVLDSLDWPITGTASSSSILSKWDSQQKNFTNLFLNLMKMDENMSKECDRKVTLFDPLPLPLELMVLPLRKRFKYHFKELRKTNVLEKVYKYVCT